MKEHRLTFDPAQTADQTRYKYLYCAWNKFAVSSAEGPQERGPLSVDFNARLLDALDAVSDPIESEVWPALNLQAHGFTARELHAGLQTVVLSPVQLKRLTIAVELMAVQVDVITQARVFRDLFEFLSTAQREAA